MKDLLSFYNDELVFFSQMAKLFAEKYPKTAGRLAKDGDAVQDPHIDRMIQSFALLTARVSKRLDSDYSQFTESLLESMYPHYLRPIPSYSIVQFGSAGKPVRCNAPNMVGRGTILRSEQVQGVACQFRTVYDVSLMPLIVVDAAFYPAIQAPGSMPLPLGVTSAIAIGIESSDEGFTFTDGRASPLRLLIDGEPSLCAALIDALLIRSVGAFVQIGSDDPWLPLKRIPLRLAGLDEQEAMIPFTARSHPAFRLLTEYFAYPDKFSFIDIDLSELATRLPPGCQRFTLHMALSGGRNDSARNQLLASLSSRNFLTSCTPVINLFERSGVPLQLTHTRADYPLRADASHCSGYEIHTVKSVRLVREQENGDSGITEFSPLYGIRHGERTVGKGNYWLTRRDETMAELSPGHEISITLVDSAFDVSGRANVTLSTELTCTNRNLPSLLRYGHPAGDLTSDSVPPEIPVRLLRKPTASQRFDAGAGAHWRLVSHLALNYSTLTDVGIPDFHKMLLLYDVADSATIQRQISGIVGLQHGTVRAWVDTLPVPSLMPGIGIRMTIDEQAFVGSSLFVFAQVMERYFALHGQLNCFTQLEIISLQSGQEIFTCQPRCVEKTRA